MKKLFVAAILLGIFSHAIAQTESVYYYYQGKKYYLQVTYSQFTIGVKPQNSFARNTTSFAAQLQLPADSVTPAAAPNQFFIRPEKKVAGGKQLMEDIRQKSFVSYVHPGLLGLNSKLVSYGDAFIVKLKPNVTQQQFTTLLAKYHCSVMRRSTGDKNTYLLSAGRQNNYDALATANLLYETGSFIYAQPDFTTHNGLAAPPNDPLYNRQWAHHNTGSADQHSGTPGADIKVDSAWQITQGDATIKIAVIDTGVDTAQADLKKNLIQGYDCVSMTANPGDGAPRNLANGHGTGCAGIIGAAANNNIGVAGIAPNCKIMPVNINDQFNNFADDFGIASGIDYSWQNGADVLSNSWYTGTPSGAIDDAIHRAVTQGRGGKGCIVFFAAGNDNAGISYPAFNAEVIAVGASSMCNQRKLPGSCDGEYWWGSSFGNGLDIMAPGVLIPTTDISGANGYNTADGSAGDYNLTFNGTSAATPHASAVAALVLSVDKTLTGAAVRAIIENNCIKAGDYNYAITQGNFNGTWNNEMGYGIVNAYKSVLAAQNKAYCSAGITKPATTTLCKNGTIKLTVADSSASATYTWRLNGTDIKTGGSIVVNTEGSYDVVASFPGNCIAYAPAIVIKAADTVALMADAGKPIFLCPGSNGAIIGGEPSARGGTPFIAAQRAYGYDLLFNTFIRFDIDNPRDYTFITPVAPPELPVLAFVAGDFTPLGYYVINQGGALARVDTATGKIGYIGQLVAENGQYISRTWCGLAWNPVTKKLYGFTTGNLADGVYEIDPVTAQTKWVAYQGQYSFLTWHTFNNKGSLFGYSTTYNKIYRSKILDNNAGTFASNDIGVTMLAQLDGSFDPITSKLYFTTYAYAQTLFGDLREVDTATGKITVNGAIGRTSETGALAIAGGTYKYTWGPAAGLSNIHDANPVANPATTTTYTLTVTDACGAQATSQVVVTANAPKPAIAIKATKDSICIGDSTRLSVTQNPNYTYQWFFNGLLLKNVTDTFYTTGRGGQFKVNVAYGRGGCVNTSKTFTVKDCSIWLKNNNTDTACYSYLYPPHGYIDSGIMPNEHYVKTIYPAKQGDRLRITFSQIDIKSVFSKLSIYDGPSTASPLLRTISFYDYLNQKASYTSSTGPLTFELETGSQPDNVGVWDAFLTCVTPYVYISKQNGSFGDPSTWLIKTGDGVYENATKPPVYTDDSIIIRKGHTVTVSNYYNQVDEVWVQKGATLVFNDGLQISGGGSFGLVADGDIVLNGITQIITATKVFLRGGFTTTNPGNSIAGMVYADGTLPQVFNVTSGTNISSLHVLNKKGLTIHGRIRTDSLFINTPGGLTMDSSSITRALKLDTGIIHIPVPGVMDLSSYNLVYDPGSKTSYVDGAVMRGLPANYAVHYPIGTAKAFRPLDLVFEKYVNDMFTVRVVDSPAPALPLPAGINRVSTQSYYNVKMLRNYPFAGLAVTIPYYKGDGITDPANLRIVRDSAGHWVNIGGNGTHADTGTITSTGKFTLIGSFALANADGGTNTLPVTWLNFTAALKNKQVLLQWDVTREINISHYAVEHSIEGIHFNTLAQVAANNNNGNNNSYQYLHTNPQQGINYYRIKEVDKDGKYAYTKIIVVTAESLAVIVSPNPAHDMVTITAGNTIQQVDCYNAIGQLVKTVTPALNRFTMDVKQLPAGVYTVRVITTTGTYNTKIVKE